MPRTKSLADDLTPRQLKFAEEYVKDFNGTKAAMRAGYATKSACQTAYEMLRNPRIKDAVSRAASRKLTQFEDANITAEEIIKQFSRLCRADLRRVIDAEGNLLAVKDWPEDMASAIASVEVVVTKAGDRTTKLKLWDKVSALTSMAKHFGLLKDLSEHTGTITYGWLGDDDPPAEGPTH